MLWTDHVHTRRGALAVGRRPQVSRGLARLEAGEFVRPGAAGRVHTRGGIPLVTLGVADEYKGMLCMEFASKGAHTPMLCVGGNSPTLALIDLIAQRVVVTAGQPRRAATVCVGPRLPPSCAQAAVRYQEAAVRYRAPQPGLG